MHVLLSAFLALGSPLMASAVQDPAWVEIRFHRIHLRNGNFIDGSLIRQDSKEVVVKLPTVAGELAVRVDQIDRVEFIKMRGPAEKPETLKIDRGGPTTSALVTSDRSRPVKNVETTPIFKATEETRRKVDALLAELAHTNDEGKLSVMDRLGSVGGDAGPYLASLLDKVDRAEISIVTAAVVKNKDERSIPILGKLTLGQDTMLRTAAASALGGLANPSAVPLLLPLLKDKEATVRATAVTSLREMPDRQVFEALLVNLNDSDKEVRNQTIQISAAMGKSLEMEAEYADGIVRALEKANLRAKFDLLMALGRTKIKSKWTDIAPYLGSDEAELRSGAASALTALGAQEAGRAVADQANSETDNRVKIQLCTAARQLAAKGAVDALIRWLRDDNEQVHVEALNALQILTGQKLGDNAGRWEAWRAENRDK